MQKCIEAFQAQDIEEMELKFDLFPGLHISICNPIDIHNVTSQWILVEKRCSHGNLHDINQH